MADGKVVILGDYDIGVDSEKTMAQSASVNLSGQEVRAIDKDGNVVGSVVTQITKERTVEVIVGTGDSVPKIGENFDDGKVISVSKNSSNSDFARYSVTTISFGNNAP